MAERVRTPEAAATRLADGHMDARKARTRKWLWRGFAGVAAGLVLISAAIVTAIPFPALGVGLFFGGVAAEVYGGVSTAIGVGSGIVNTFSRKR